MSNDISKKESRKELKSYAESFDVPYRRVLELYHIYRKDGLSREQALNEVYERLASITDEIHKSADVLEDVVKSASRVIGDKAALEHYRFYTRNIPKKVKKYVNTDWESKKDKWDYDEDWLNDE